MPAPRTPLAKAKLTGADKKDPQRYRDRSEPTTSGLRVGDPPRHMTGARKAAWLDLAADLGWLEREDRVALEIASVAIAQVRDLVKAGEPVPASLLAAVNTSIGKLGASPTDRAKVFQAADDDDAANPFAQFQ